MEPILIAVGVIVFVLLVSLTALGMWMMRRRRITFKELVTGRKDYTQARQNRRLSITPSFEPDWKTTSSDSWDQEFFSKPTKEITPPPLVICKNDNRLPSFDEPSTPSKASISFLEDATPPRHSELSNHSRNVSLAPSLYSLPEKQQYTRLSTMFPHPPETSAASFQQFMANRRNTATKNGRLSANSRVSTGTTRPDGRESVATTASTRPHFRTVDSWVGQQSNAIDSEKLQQHVEEGIVPPVPQMPKEQYRSRHLTQNSDATVFRQHPGTEVVIPRGSLVPSEILNEGGTPSAL